MSKIKENTRITPDWLLSQPIDIQMEVMRSHFEVCRLVINSILDQEVDTHVGGYYSHDKPYSNRYNRWGYNPSSVRIGSSRMKIDVPRIMDMESKKVKSLETARELRKLPGQTEQIVQGVINGLSTRKHEQVLDVLSEGFGLSKSSVSRQYLKGSKEALKEFENRKLESHEIVSIFIDGKYMRTDQIIIALGILSNGQKIALGFIQAHSENSGPIKDFLKSLKKRGLQYKQGILWIVDGSKGIHKAIREEFGKYAIIQRCIWHKIENIKKYVSEKYHEEITKMYYDALSQPTYKSAYVAMLSLIKHLHKLNVSAANSLQEGLKELLTLHKLGVNKVLNKSLRTSNCIESLNSTIQDRVGRIKRYNSSSQRYRWVAMALLEIEQGLRKIRGFKHIPLLQKALLNFVNHAK